MSIFDRLGYNPSLSGGAVTDYSDAVIKHMNALPPMLTPWQTTDIANSDVSGYLQNPVANITQQIWNTSNTITSIPGLASTNVSQIYVASNTLSGTTANNFMHHTNRISGVEALTPDTATLPHYSSAIGVGKVLSYIVYQSDGVQNNAPIMGNFTSLFTQNDLVTYFQAIQGYPTIIMNSMSSYTDPNTMITTYSSNMTQTMANTISAELSSISTYMNTRINADVNFYTNSQAVVADYNTTKQFTNMGGTQTDLVNNFIGTTKLTSRINS